ncbi:hypothetical protein [Pseudooceanicola sp.]|uniref:hypothetical protein n=1 Tax=Pseudooceanicola sp. TaxID=1914328 RepID=UPI0035C70F53
MDKSDFATLVANEILPEGRMGHALDIHRNPPGRGVSAERRAMAAWLSALTEEDRARIEHLMADAREAAVFGMLVLLDDATQYRDGEEVGELRLEYRDRDGGVTHLNAPRGEDLHDLFKWALKDRETNRTPS